jgi:hypothetical protein
MVDTAMEEHLLICEFNDGAKADDVDNDDNGIDDDYEIIVSLSDDDVVNDKEDDYGGLFEFPAPDGEVVTCSKKGCKWQCFVINDFVNKDAVIAKHITDNHCCDGGDGRSAAPEPNDLETVIGNDDLETHEKSWRRYVQEKAAACSYAAACSAQPQDPSSRLPRAAYAASCACRHTASGCVAHLQDPPPPAPERKKDRVNKLLARAAQNSLKEERKRRTNVSKEVIVLLL